MAKFGVDVTQLSQPDTGAAKYVAPAVVDKSSVSTLKFLGEQAVDAYKGYQLADLEQQQEQNISDYMQRRDNPAIAQEAAIEAASLDATRASLFLRGASEEEVDPITKQFQSKLQRYKSAMEQGVMTPQELSERILSTTREAVNRNPGLYNELLQHSSKVLELSGISNILKVDQKMQEDQRAQQSKLLEQVAQDADKYHVTYDHRTLGSDLNRVIGEINNTKKAVAAADALTRYTQQQDVITKEQAKSFVVNQGASLITGDMSQIVDTYSGAFRNAGPGEVAALKFQLKQDVANRKQRLVVAATKGGILNDPQTQALIKQQTESLDAFISSIDPLVTGKDAADVMDNKYRRLKAEQDFGFASKYDVPSLQALRLIPDPIWQKWALNNPQNLDGMMKLTDDLINTTIGSPALTAAMTTGTIDPKNTDATSVAFGLFDGGDQPAFEKAVGTLRQAVIDRPVFQNEEQKLKFMEGFIKELGAPQRKGKFNNVSSETIQDTYKIVDEYVTMSGTWMQKKLQEYKDKNILVRADVLPDGRLTFTSSNTQAATDMNRNFAARVNEGLAGIANMMNVSVKEAAKTTYPRYQETLWGVSGQDTGAIPRPIGGVSKPTGERLVIKNTDDLMKALQSGKITGAEFEAVARDMLLGKNQ